MPFLYILDLISSVQSLKLDAIEHSRRFLDADKNAGFMNLTISIKQNL